MSRQCLEDTCDIRLDDPRLLGRLNNVKTLNKHQSGSSCTVCFVVAAHSNLSSKHAPRLQCIDLGKHTAKRAHS